ncbi:MAG: hypothetical protein MUF38_01430 [Anaerolineae bacterium]|jgi:hypothetical protein|nr:hypothetical protein [Anaerolineae bacterium]
MHGIVRLKSFKVCIVLAMLVLTTAVAFAQTNTPIPPTATNVAISVDTNEIFTSANSWIVTFTPIISIGLGISIAIAILLFIGREILKAFRGGGGGR